MEMETEVNGVENSPAQKDNKNHWNSVFLGDVLPPLKIQGYEKEQTPAELQEAENGPQKKKNLESLREMMKGLMAEETKREQDEVKKKERTVEEVLLDTWETNLPSIIRCQKIVRGYLARQEYKQIKKMRTKRDKVANEILVTERSYVRSLNILLTKFLEPILANDKFKEEWMKTLHQDIAVILNFNSLILKTLEERLHGWETHPNQTVGDVFLQLGVYLKAYTQYTSHYQQALITVEKLMSDPKFVTFVESLRESAVAEVGNLYMRDYLIMPIQRIPRYTLLLKELLQSTWKSHADYSNLKSAFKQISQIADTLNKSQGDASAMNRIIKIRNLLIGSKAEKLELVEPQRRFVDEIDCFEVTGGHKQRHIFLFNDLLLVAKPVKSEQFFLKTWCRLIGINSVKKANIKGKPVLSVYSQEVVQFFEMETEDQVNSWCSQIQHYVTDSVEREKFLKERGAVSLNSGSTSNVSSGSASPGPIHRDKSSSLILASPSSLLAGSILSPALVSTGSSSSLAPPPSGSMTPQLERTRSQSFQKNIGVLKKKIFAPKSPSTPTVQSPSRMISTPSASSLPYSSGTLPLGLSRSPRSSTSPRSASMSSTPPLSVITGSHSSHTLSVPSLETKKDETTSENNTDSNTQVGEKGEQKVEEAPRGNEEPHKEEKRIQQNEEKKQTAEVTITIEASIEKKEEIRANEINVKEPSVTAETITQKADAVEKEEEVVEKTEEPSPEAEDKKKEKKTEIQTEEKVNVVENEKERSSEVSSDEELEEGVDEEDEEDEEKSVKVVKSARKENAKSIEGDKTVNNKEASEKHKSQEEYEEGEQEEYEEVEEEVDEDDEKESIPKKTESDKKEGEEKEKTAEGKKSETKKEVKEKREKKERKEKKEKKEKGRSSSSSTSSSDKTTNTIVNQTEASTSTSPASLSPVVEGGSCVMREGISRRSKSNMHGRRTSHMETSRSSLKEKEKEEKEREEKEKEKEKEKEREEKEKEKEKERERDKKGSVQSLKGSSLVSTTSSPTLPCYRGPMSEQSETKKPSGSVRDENSSSQSPHKGRSHVSRKSTASTPSSTSSSPVLIVNEEKRSEKKGSIKGEKKEKEEKEDDKEKEKVEKRKKSESFVDKRRDKEKDKEKEKEKEKKSK